MFLRRNLIFSFCNIFLLFCILICWLAFTNYIFWVSLGKFFGSIKFDKRFVAKCLNCIAKFKSSPSFHSSQIRNGEKNNFEEIQKTCSIVGALVVFSSTWLFFGACQGLLRAMGMYFFNTGRMLPNNKNVILCYPPCVWCMIIDWLDVI